MRRAVVLAVAATAVGADDDDDDDVMFAVVVLVLVLAVEYSDVDVEVVEVPKCQESGVCEGVGRRGSRKNEFAVGLMVEDGIDTLVRWDSPAVVLLISRRRADGGR